MTKLAALAALLLVIADPAWSKTLVVEETLGAGESNVSEIETIQSFNYIAKEVLRSFLKDTVTYTTTRSVATEDLRTGIVVWNRGTAGAYSEAFDAVILVNPTMSSTGAGRARPDSALRIALGGPRVPMLYLFGDRQAFSPGTIRVATTACCTTGVSDVANPFIEQAYISRRTPTRVWQIDGMYNMAAITSATPPAAGFRKLVSMGYPAYAMVQEYQGRNCGWCDSLLHPTTSDTVAVWELPYAAATGVSAMKSVVFAYCDGAGGFTDSLNSANGGPSSAAEGSPVTMLIGLARLDSLTGGRVLKRRAFSFVIDGGWTRGNRHDGFFEPDSATLKRAIDSLATLDIPLTIGVNTDSLSSYSRDKTWWAALSKLKYAPQPSTNAGAGSSSYQFPHDVWGRNRSRIVYGGGGLAGADSSIDALLKGAAWKCDSTFGKEKVERFVLAPADDWTPSNFAGTMLDSLGWVAARNGFSGFRVDTRNESPTGDRPGTGSTRTSGFGTQFNWREPIGGRLLKMLGNNGGPVAGGSYQWTTFRDSVGPNYDSTLYRPMYVELTRGWYGFMLRGLPLGNVDAWPQSTYEAFYGVTNATPFMDVVIPKSDLPPYRPTPSFIKTLHVRDFSGSPTNTYWGTAPLNGWWILKSMVMAAREINATAGRTIVDFTYPSSVTLP